MNNNEIHFLSKNKSIYYKLQFFLNGLDPFKSIVTGIDIFEDIQSLHTFNEVTQKVCAKVEPR